MNHDNWDYYFLPPAIALLLLVFSWKNHSNQNRFGWLIFLTVIFWVIASLIIVARIYMRYFASFKGVMTQDFWGYIAGGALTLLVPFTFISIFLFVSRVKKFAPHWTMIGAVLFSFIIVWFFPPLFFTGSLIGCVMAGGKTCM
jgi:hypothetical protein